MAFFWPQKLPREGQPCRSSERLPVGGETGRRGHLLAGNHAIEGKTVSSKSSARGKHLKTARFE